MRRRMGALVLLAAVAAGCGDSEDVAATSTTKAPSIPMPTTSTTVATPSSSAGLTDPALAAKATAAVLQSADFPPGWQPKPADQQLEQETTWRELTRCLGVEDSGQGRARATSPTFGTGQATQVVSTVEYLPTASAPAVAMAFAGPKFAACAKEALTAGVKRNAPPGAAVGAVEVAPLDFPKLGLLTSASRATTEIDMGPVKIPIFQDFVFVFKGEAVSRFTYLNPGAPFRADLQPTLAEKVVGRS